MRYRAFLSYSHADVKWARWLHRKLEAYRPPGSVFVGAEKDRPERLSPIFRDWDELPSTASLSVAVAQALRDSEWLIVICSPSAAASHWVNEEIRQFRQLGRSDRILCFMVAGEPHSGDETECFPSALTEPLAENTPPVEPVAADARPHGDGKTSALLRVIAGMLGVGFDALKHRHQSRRVRHLLAVTAVSLMISALTIGLAVVATLARDEAYLRRTQAEDLIDFMLGDLQEQLREIGRLDLYESIGDEALEYFSALSSEDAGEYSLFQRAKNLRQIGEVRLEQGNTSDALIAFQESRLITSRLAESDPDDAEIQIALANSYFYIGAVHWQRGELQDARREFERVIPIVDAVAAREPDNAAWLVEQGYGHTNLGRVRELEGALDEALSAYQNVMRINQRLVELEPDNLEWTLEVGFAHNNIGKLVYSLGRLEEAEEHYREDLAHKELVANSAPQHTIWRYYLTVSQHYLGQLLARRGEYAEARSLLRIALSSFQELVDLDPDQIDWQRRLAVTERELGELSVRLDQLDQAASHIDSSIRKLQHLSSADEIDVNSRRDLVRSLLSMAHIEIHTDALESARAHVETANRHIDTLLAQEPTSRETQMFAIYSDICTALLDSADDEASAVSSYALALERIADVFPYSSDPDLLEFQWLALAGLGRAAEAQATRDRLRRMGFVSAWHAPDSSLKR